ncbi:DoxX family protein [Emticicia sp. BO119]|nr:DoxX family protein [Emticicia sp. BO119]
MTTHQTNSKLLNMTSWLCQILLSITFIWAAGMKWFEPMDQLAQMWPWTADNPLLTKITGVFDFAAGLGLVLPMALLIRPVLTLYAACGTLALMLAAIVFHVSRGESSQIGFNVFVLLMAGFIAWVRGKKTIIHKQ